MVNRNLIRSLDDDEIVNELAVLALKKKQTSGCWTGWNRINKTTLKAKLSTAGSLKSTMNGP